MVRTCCMLLLALCAFTSQALADDDWDEGTDVIRIDTPQETEATATPNEHQHGDLPAGAPIPAEGSLGAYFGLGDVFLYNGMEHGVATASAGSPSPWDADNAPPAHEDYSMLRATDGVSGTDNVLGPLWGVPAGASGLEGVDPADPRYLDPHAAHSQAGDTDAADAEDEESDISNHSINRADPNDW